MKNSILCFYVIILITMLSCTVNAADSTIRTNDRPPKLSDMPKFCREAEGEVGLALCLANKNEEVEGYLRRVEGKIKKDLEPDEKALFQKASSDWLKFVDSTCDYDTNGLGSMKGSVISS